MSHKANDIYNEQKFEDHVEECGMCHNNQGECIETVANCEEHSIKCVNYYDCHDDCNQCEGSFKKIDI